MDGAFIVYNRKTVGIVIHVVLFCTSRMQGWDILNPTLEQSQAPEMRAVAQDLMEAGEFHGMCCKVSSFGPWSHYFQNQFCRPESSQQSPRSSQICQRFAAASDDTWWECVSSLLPFALLCLSTSNTRMPVSRLKRLAYHISRLISHTSQVKENHEAG